VSRPCEPCDWTERATELHPPAGARVRELATGRVGTVMEYVPGLDATDATHRVTFDLGHTPTGHPVTVSVWLCASEIVEVDDDSAYRERARALAVRVGLEIVACAREAARC
jgi:hypothetical protein